MSGGASPRRGAAGHGAGVWGGAALVAAFHLALAAAYRWGAGLANHGGPRTLSWEEFWQHLPFDLMRERLLESLWWDAAQLPLHNLVAGGVLRAVGEARFHGAMQALFVAMGAAACGAAYVVLRRLVASRRWAMGAALVVAADPSLLVLEAYLLYDVPTLFLVMAGAAALARAEATRRAGPLAAFAAALSALMLTRALFHPALWVAAALLGARLTARATRAWTPARRVAWLAAVALVAAAPWGWYAKNAAQFGFFGGSSWFGYNVWRAVSLNMKESERRALADAGVIDDWLVIRASRLHPPERYRELGFEAVGHVEVLRREDRHHLLYVEVGAAHAEAARRLVGHDPRPWLRSLPQAYRLFALPASDWLEESRALLHPVHEGAWHGVLLGRSAALALHAAGGPFIGTLMALYVPAVVAWWGAGLLRGGARRGAARIARRPLAAWMALLVAWVTVFGTALEFGENMRFQFYVSLLVYVGLAQVGWAASRGAGRARRRRRGARAPRVSAPCG